jgi:hypothetical protein
MVTQPAGGDSASDAAEDQRQVFVNMVQETETLKLAADELRLQARWPLARCRIPSSRAIGRAGRMYIGCRRPVMVRVNFDNGHVIATLPIGDPVGATSFDPETCLNFNYNGEGIVAMIHQDNAHRYAVEENII